MSQLLTKFSQIYLFTNNFVSLLLTIKILTYILLSFSISFYTLLTSSSCLLIYLSTIQSDLYGQSLLNITHPDDHAFLKQQLIPTDLHNLFSAKSDENGEIRSRTKEEEEEIDLKLREDRRDFTIRYIFIHYYISKT